MKNIYIIILSSILLFSCSGDDFSIQPDTPFAVNEKPSIPSLVYPTNNLLCTNFELEFDWNAAIDINGDLITYIIEIATDNQFSSILFTAVTSETLRAFNLEKGTTYYWRVKARDNQNNESAYSSVQTFFTEPDAGVNTIPFAPTVVSPNLEETISGSTASLDWNAIDNDGDPLLYDLYFGNTNPPTLLAENLVASTFDVAISANTEYFWRVVVKDNQQGVTIGRVWNFRTQ